jgi:hypothetical protein
MGEKTEEGKSLGTEENPRRLRPYKNVFGVDPANLSGIPGGQKPSGYRILFTLHSVHHGGSGECPDQQKTRR